MNSINFTLHNNSLSNISATVLQGLFGHSLSKSFSEIVGLSFITIITVAVIGNVTLISAIISTRRLHSVLHVFIVNLAVSNLITALGTIPFDVEYMLRGYFPHGKIPCGVMQTVFLISLPSSVRSLMLLTAERFIVVVYPCKIRR